MACKLECIGNASDKHQYCIICNYRDKCNILCDCMDNFEYAEDCDEWEEDD